MEIQKHFQTIQQRAKAKFQGAMKLSDFDDAEFTEELINPTRLTGYATPYSALDAIVGGVKPRCLTILVASQGVGKSLFGLNLLVDYSNRGLDVVYLDLENGRHVSIERIVRMKYQLNSIGNISADEMTGLIQGVDHFTYYDHVLLGELAKADGKNLTKDQAVYEAIRTEAMYGKAKIFLVDPFQAMVDTNAEGENYAMGDVAETLKNMAQDLNIAIIVCHHLRKGSAAQYVESHDELPHEKFVLPTRDSIRGSSKIVDRATDVWGLLRFPNRPTEEERSVTTLDVIKNRTGLSGRIYFRFEESTLTFNQMTSDSIEDVKDIFGKESIVVEE